MAPTPVDILGFSPRLLSFLTVMLLHLWISVECVELTLFYPFGPENRDKSMDPADDASTVDVRVEEAFILYNTSYRNIYVNTNGHVSFDSEFPSYRVDMALPLGYHLVAPFYADVDITGIGRIYYRNTSEPGMIQRAAVDIHESFSNFQGYMPTTLFIVTWDRVGYFKEKSDLTNTFQLVLASDGKATFALFHYLDNGMTWQRSDGKFAPSHPDIPPQAGFDGGEGGMSYLLPGSGETGAFVTGSNVNAPGKWMFQIGDVGAGNVRPADMNEGEVTVFAPQAQTGCAMAESLCHANAKCIDHDRGFCCQCVKPFYGNGYECLRKGTPQTLNSRFYGTLNGFTLSDDVYMHTYVVTTDGRTYSAISGLPPPIATAMQTLNSIGGIIGWLFASPINDMAVNGYTMTGGHFNRSAVVTFQSTDGSPDKVVRINQVFHGHESPNKLRMDTRLEGELPDIPVGSDVKIDDYMENFTKTRRGTIQSYIMRSYRLDNVKRRYSWNQTITFEETCDSGNKDMTPKTLRLSVGKHYVRHNPREGVVRYAMTSRVGLASGQDPCTSLGKQCHSKAECITTGDTFQCVCGSGYYGDGGNCQDVDECRQNVCDRNARCQNLPGSFRCECNRGYSGNGHTCTPEVARCGTQVCDANAQCVFDVNLNQRMCECNQGYQGDGQRCAVEQSDCRSRDICGANARCVYDDMLMEYACECLDDFSGDGYSCEAVDPGCNACDRNAECVTNQLTNKESCECRPGFSGNGRDCTIIDICSKCDFHAQCVFDDRINTYRCVCVRGYQGDGESCSMVDCRNQTGMCAKEGGLCWLNPQTNMGICRCNYGYRGDGFRCEKVGCDVYNTCDRNARCVSVAGQYVCQCNEGFTGTGRRCRPDASSCDVYNFCDRNAKCVADANDPPMYSCRCDPGFEGDGRRCRLTATSCDQYNFCDRNAKCVPDTSDPPVFSCRCESGFEGDGRRCRAVATSMCTDYNDCAGNAKCLPDTSNPPIFTCRCDPGYEGDGKRCRETSSSCNVYNDCDANAKCTPDRNDPSGYSCRCLSGFEGDGKQCREIAIPCNQVDNCDRNAACQLNPDSQSFQCVCNAGYDGNGRDCRRKDVPDCRRDRRMCDTNAECTQGADNAYVCVCKQGFRGNGATCTYVVDEGEFLLYAQGSKLMKVSVEPKPGDMGQQVAYLEGQMAVGVDVDCKDGHIYWSDVANGVIRRSDAKGENIEIILKDLKSPEGVAVDFSARTLFFSDSVLDVVRVSSLDGSMVKTLVDNDMVNPRAIALDITRGTVYWTDWNRNKPQIEKINMDGSGRQILVYEDLRLPNGLAYDSFSQLLCWGDAGEKSIECIRSDGVGRRVVHQGASYPFDVTMLNNVIYWSDWKKRDIPNINQNGGDLNDPLILAVGGHGRLYGITAVRDQCPRARNSCGLNNGGCSHLCLASPNGGRTCACPDGADPRICQ